MNAPMGRNLAFTPMRKRKIGFPPSDCRASGTVCSQIYFTVPTDRDAAENAQLSASRPCRLP